MSRTIWKYNISPSEDQSDVTIEVPNPAKLLYVGMQEWQFYAWFETESTPGHPWSRHKFYVRGTGFEVPEDVDHFQSFQQGAFVWHIYYKKWGQVYDDPKRLQV
jgi:hypothetical protein